MALTALSREEHITDISLANTNTEYSIIGGQGLPVDRFLAGLRIQYEGRWANPGANGPTAVLTEGAYGIIEHIKLEGFHRLRGVTETIFFLRGADAAMLCRLLSAHTPITTPSSLSVAAGANNDVRFIIDLGLVPKLIAPDQQAAWLLDAPNYDRLALTVKNADMLSVFTGQTTQPTITAYGSASGSPRLRVSGQFAMDNQSFAGVVPGRMFTTFSEVTSGDIVSTTTINQSRLFNLNKGYFIRGLMLKTGLKSTAPTAGNNAYSSLLHTVLTNIKVNRGLGRHVRFFADQYALAESLGFAAGITAPAGYGWIDFCQSGTLREAFDARSIISGPSGDTDFYLSADVSGGAANTAALLVQQELRYRPQLGGGKRG